MPSDIEQGDNSHDQKSGQKGKKTDLDAIRQRGYGFKPYPQASESSHSRGAVEPEGIGEQSNTEQTPLLAGTRTDFVQSFLKYVAACSLCLGRKRTPIEERTAQPADASQGDRPLLTMQEAGTRQKQDEILDREIEKINNYFPRLLDWAKESQRGKGPEIGPEIGQEEINTIEWLATYVNCKYPSALKPSEGSTNRKSDEINTIQRLASHPYHEFLDLKSSDGDTEQDDSASKDAALGQLSSIAQELQAWDQYRLGRKDRPFTMREAEIWKERDLERKGRINHLLQQLPEKLPSILDMPSSQLWQVYIDKPDHEDAKQLKNPGRLYNKAEQPGIPKSPGYQKGMEDLLHILAILERQRREQQAEEAEGMTYETYEMLHDVVIGEAPSDKKEFMSQPNGLDRDNPDYSFYIIQPYNDRIEGLATLKEISGEFYNGLPLFQDWPTDVERPEQFYAMAPEIAKALPRGITIGYEATDSLHGSIEDLPLELPKGTIVVCPLYSIEEDRELIINAILESRYKGRKEPRQSAYGNLRRIAKAARAFDIMHPHFDANGRLHQRGNLNMWLEEEGFSSVILPNKSFKPLTVDGYVEEILIGMHNFIDVVNQFKGQAETIGDKLQRLKHRSSGSVANS